MSKWISSFLAALALFGFVACEDDALPPKPDAASVDAGNKPDGSSADGGVGDAYSKDSGPAEVGAIDPRALDAASVDVANGADVPITDAGVADAPAKPDVAAPIDASVSGDAADAGNDGNRG